MSFNRTVETILENANTDWVLYFRLGANDNIDKGEYVFTPYKSITPRIETVIKKGRAIAETKEIVMYSYRKGKYEYMVLVGVKEALEIVLGQYKSRYGSNLKDVTLQLKPKTKKHFGDIMDSLE